MPEEEVLETERLPGALIPRNTSCRGPSNNLAAPNATYGHLICASFDLSSGPFVCAIGWDATHIVIKTYEPGGVSMHQRLFHYAMLVYALGFIAALTLNVDMGDETSRGTAKTAAKIADVPTPALAANCADEPDVHVVASQEDKGLLKQADVKAPCAAAPQEMRGSMVQPKAVIPTAATGLPKDL
jgi:hypothetical protein